MARKTLGATAVLRSICALFMLICILFFILPHAHQCAGEDCPVCMLQNVLSEMLFAACFFGILPVFLWFAGDVAYFLKQSAPQTLVHLKVKLSD